MYTELDQCKIESFSFKGDYVIDMVFFDGKIQTIDFGPVIGKGWMSKLKDIAYFRQVRLNDAGNFEWPDGQDFNPEALYNWPDFEQIYIDEINAM